MQSLKYGSFVDPEKNVFTKKIEFFVFLGKYQKLGGKNRLALSSHYMLFARKV